MSDPVQQVVAGNEFNEGYRYVHMRERDVELMKKATGIGSVNLWLTTQYLLN